MWGSYSRQWENLVLCLRTSADCPRVFPCWTCIPLKSPRFLSPWSLPRLLEVSLRELTSFPSSSLVVSRLTKFFFILWVGLAFFSELLNFCSLGMVIGFFWFCWCPNSKLLDASSWVTSLWKIAGEFVFGLQLWSVVHFVVLVLYCCIYCLNSAMDGASYLSEPWGSTSSHQHCGSFPLVNASDL